MKKLVSFIVFVCMLLTVTFTLCACDTSNKDEKESKVMTVSCNPEIELILDGDQKVVTVNALNEEGNMIISAQTSTETFKGLDADDAVELFVKIAEETGFLIKGSATMKGNTINVAISGDTESAKKIYESVKQTVQAKIDELGLSTQIADFKSLANDYLKEKLQEAESYLSNAEINSLSYDELVAKIENSRKETENMVSQELKDLYYQVKENAVMSAKIEEAKNKLNIIQQAGLTIVQKLYDDACTQITNTMNTYLVKSDSLYQTALTKFRKAKAEYLNLRAYLVDNDIEALKSTLTTLDTAVTDAETALNTAYTDAMNDLKTFQTSLNNAYIQIVSAITQASSNLQTIFDTTTESVLNNVKTTATSFETTYSEYITSAKTEWKNFKDTLITGYTQKDN